MDLSLVHRELSVSQAIAGRRSIRRFLPKTIPDGTIATILEAASRAPSNMNVQPWLVHVVTGETQMKLSAALFRAVEAGKVCPEFRYNPEVMKEPVLSRKRKVGFDLYALCGIERHDAEARKVQFLRNYDFFGSPIGLFFTMDRYQELGSWLDCGMMMQNVMLLARSFGLETCPQQAWYDFGEVVHRELAIPEDHIILSGMSIGFVDFSAPDMRLQANVRVSPNLLGGIGEWWVGLE